MSITEHPTRPDEGRANVNPLFHVDIDDRAHETVVTLHGELDYYTRPLLVAAISRIDASASLIVLDMSDLTFIDGGGAGHILRWLTLAAGRGSALLFRAPSAQVRRVFEVVGM